MLDLQYSLPPSLPLLSRLQQSHSLIQQHLQEALQSLQLQIQLQHTRSALEKDRLLSESIRSTIQEQRFIRSVFSHKLLQRQVRAEKDEEMKEIIHNYQKRIFDLRSALISKEAEINALESDGPKDCLRRQTLHLAASISLDHQNLLKNLQERKKLTVQIEALKHTIGHHFDRQPQIDSHCLSNKNPKSNIQPHSQQITEKQNFLGRDGLIDRAINVLIEQTRIQEQLQKQLQILSRQASDIEYKRKQLKQQYLVSNNRSSRLEESQNYLLTKNASSQVKPESSTKYLNLLTNIEINQLQGPLIECKIKSKGISLRERNHRKKKEN